jgi:hypothetical protein
MKTKDGFDEKTGIWHMPNGREIDLTQLKLVQYDEDSGFTFKFHSGPAINLDTFSGGEIIQKWLQAIFIKSR